MVDPLWPILAVATLAPLGIGLLPLAGREIPQRGLHSLLGLTAGLLLGVAFLDLIPEAIHHGGETIPLVLGGAFLSLYLVEWVIGVHGHGHHDHGEEEPGDHFARDVRFPALAIVGLGLHTFVDGLVLPAVFETGTGVGLRAGLAVAAHQAPDGFAAAVILLGAGASRRTVVGGVVAVSLLTPLGALAGLPLAGEPAWLPILLAIAAGTFLFIAVAELLPELHHGPHQGRVTIATLVGFGLVALMGQLLGLHI